MKTKIRSYGDEATDFYSSKIPEAGCNYMCWSVLVIDSALKKDENYYLQVLLKECKYTEKEKKVIRYITDDTKFSSEYSMNLMRNKLRLSMMEDLKKNKFVCAKIFFKSNRYRPLSLKREWCT